MTAPDPPALPGSGRGGAERAGQRARPVNELGSTAPTTPATPSRRLMIRRYIAWRNRHAATHPRLREVVTKAETIKRAKVAWRGTSHSLM